jgi:DNA-binding transcriptional regulator YhcF (GntR family)
MSISLMSAVWKLDLQSGLKYTLLALADSANDEGYCWPSLASLIEKTNQSRRTVIEVLKKLEEKGLIEKTKRCNTSTIYKIHPLKNSTIEASAKSAPGAKSARGVVQNLHGGGAESALGGAKSAPLEVRNLHPKPNINPNITQRETELGGFGQNSPPPLPPPPSGLKFYFTGDEDIDPNCKILRQLSDDWGLPEDFFNYATALGMGRDAILIESHKFKGYWLTGKGAGKRRTMRGWSASWQNWINKTAQRS